MCKNIFVMASLVALLAGCAGPEADVAEQRQLERDNDRWTQRQIADNGMQVTVWQETIGDSNPKEADIAAQTKVVEMLEVELADTRLKLTEEEIKAEPDRSLVEHYRRLERSQEIRLARERTKLSQLEGKQSVFDTSWRQTTTIGPWFGTGETSSPRDPWTKYHR